MDENRPIEAGTQIQGQLARWFCEPVSQGRVSLFQGLLDMGVTDVLCAWAWVSITRPINGIA